MSFEKFDLTLWWQHLSKLKVTLTICTTLWGVVVQHSHFHIENELHTDSGPSEGRFLSAIWPQCSTHPAASAVTVLLLRFILRNRLPLIWSMSRRLKLKYYFSLGKLWQWIYQAKCRKYKIWKLKIWNVNIEKLSIWNFKICIWKKSKIWNCIMYFCDNLVSEDDLFN